MAVVTDLPDRLGVCWAGSLTSGDNGEALAQCIGVGRFDGGGEGGAGGQPDHAADLGAGRAQFGDSSGGALHCGHCVSGDVGGLPGVGGDLTDRGAHLDAGGMACTPHPTDRQPNGNAGRLPPFRHHASRLREPKATRLRVMTADGHLPRSVSAWDGPARQRVRGPRRGHGRRQRRSLCSTLRMRPALRRLATAPGAGGRDHD